jgi:hypothetical protein
MLGFDGCCEIFAGGVAQISDFGLADCGLVRVAGIVPVGRADQRELFFVGDREDDAPVAVLEEIGAWIVELLRHHDMAALHQPDIVHVVLANRA